MTRTTKGNNGKRIFLAKGRDSYSQGPKLIRTNSELILLESQNIPKLHLLTFPLDLSLLPTRCEFTVHAVPGECPTLSWAPLQASVFWKSILFPFVSFFEFRDY